MVLCGDPHKGLDIYQATGRFAIGVIVSGRVPMESSSNAQGKSLAERVFGRALPRKTSLSHFEQYPPPYSRVNFTRWTSSARLFAGKRQLFSSPASLETTIEIYSAARSFPQWKVSGGKRKDNTGADFFSSFSLGAPPPRPRIAWNTIRRIARINAGKLHSGCINATQDGILIEATFQRNLGHRSAKNGNKRRRSETRGEQSSKFTETFPPQFPSCIQTSREQMIKDFLVLSRIKRKCHSIVSIFSRSFYVNMFYQENVHENNGQPLVASSWQLRRKPFLKNKGEELNIFQYAHYRAKKYTYICSYSNTCICNLIIESEVQIIRREKIVEKILEIYIIHSF